MTEELDLETIRDRLLESLMNSGCNAVGVCTQDGLEGGPPSTDLARQIEGARSAIVFSYPLDEARAFLDAMPIERRALHEDV